MDSCWAGRSLVATHSAMVVAAFVSMTKLTTIVTHEPVPVPPLCLFSSSLLCVHADLASLAHSALFTGYYTYLSANVIVRRISEKRLNGAGAEDTALYRATRAHANYVEYTPFAFVLLFLAELNGAPTSWVHAAFTALFASRVAHCTFGINNGVIPLRKGGFLLTIVVMVSSALYNVCSH